MASLSKRGKKFYAVYFIGGKRHRISLQTESKQIAKEKLRKIETEIAKGNESPLPTRTSIKDVIQAYAEHVRLVKTAKSAQTDIYYLRTAFGDICPALEITARKVTAKCKKCPPKLGQDRRINEKVIEASCFEQITTAQIAKFIASHVRSKGLAPKTANRYREIIVRLFNWSMKEGGVRIANGRNPASNVERYKERASQIRFLSLKQVDEQLLALRDNPQLQTMVAMLIYGGFRREEILWLTHKDIDLKSGRFGVIRIRAKEVNGEYWQPKTAKNRAVPISSTLRRYLDCYAPKPSKGRWYFPSPKSLTHYDPDNLSRDLRKANKNAGLLWSCLDYRHTFGSLLASKGESLYKISTLLGNSPEICRRHYAALIPEALADCVEFDIKPLQREYAKSLA